MTLADSRGPLCLYLPDGLEPGLHFLIDAGLDARPLTLKFPLRPDRVPDVQPRPARILFMPNFPML